ncbi:hypothetical protein BZA70DRAFT_274363 [Myxozyma melibiosi]|uniref:LYR motif-containing protein Cup1-like N-terminal domain-containing protein n=1 Tax=Myxozyma melibiosi TaxID=54550 RepID=A0ABR1F9S5_9ASCO
MNQTISLYRSLLREIRFFFDPRSRLHFSYLVRTEFRQPAGLISQQLTGHQLDLALLAARKELALIKRANAGYYKECAELLERAWGVKGPVRDSLLESVVNYSEPEQQNTTELSSSTDNTPNAKPDSKDSSDSKNTSASDDRKNTGEQQSSKERKKPYYSPQLRALAHYIKLPTVPVFPTPPALTRAQGRGLAVSRVISIERKHFKRVLNSVPTPVPQEWIDDVLPRIELTHVHSTITNKWKLAFAHPDPICFGTHKLRRLQQRVGDDPFDPLPIRNLKDVDLHTSISRGERAKKANLKRPSFIRKRYLQLFSKLVTLEQLPDNSWVTKPILLAKAKPVELEPWMM